MLISYNWLKELIDLRDSPSELAERLTMAGLEVESLQALDAGWEKVVVGRVLRREPVPDSDHLTRCEVDVGTERLEIVCGAPNHRVGDKVVVALPGAVLPGGMKIGSARIRGISSKGMICSEKELGISQEASGVLILDPEAPVGGEAADVLGRRDTILEIDLTPNRADALSHLGVAREVAALTGRTLQVPDTKVVEAGPETDSLAAVEVAEGDLCPRYMGRVIEGVTVAASPDWMQARLRAVGVRPVNNVVDVTNYLLMEWGHPLHAFDWDRIRGRRIVVRCARGGESLRTLDGADRRLDPSMLLICDAKGPVAVAGIMGGENSEVTESTGRIFLEAAYFDPACIRRTARSLGLHSESSHRFERGTDIEGMARALDRAAALIQELAGGRVAAKPIDYYPVKRPCPEITLRTGRVQSLLGVSLETPQIVKMLSGLGLSIITQSGDRISVRVPSYRVDLSREIDLVEEIARLYGYDRIPSALPEVPVLLGSVPSRMRWTERVRRALAGLGYHEAIHFSFHAPRDLDRLGLSPEDPWREQVRVRNPLSEDQSVLRTSLLPGLLRTLHRNHKHFQPDQKIFEIGRVFVPRGQGLPAESERLAGAVCGAAVPPGWDRSPRGVDFFDLKGDLETLFRAWGIRGAEFTVQERYPFLHPGRSALIRAGGRELGALGELHPNVIRNLDLPDPAFCFELDLEACRKQRAERVQYHLVPRFPPVERDIALVIDESVPAGRVQARIREAAPELIRETRLFDLYRGEPIPEGKKSLAFSIRFQAADRTLTDEEVNRLRDRIVEDLGREFHAALRE